MFIADFHIHSRYSRATSSECIPEILEMWAGKKGLGLIGSGDFTHPAWRQELKEKLVPAEEGLYTLKDEHRRNGNLQAEKTKPRFIISGEISSIYKKNGKVRKVHNLIVLPGLEKADALATRLEAIGNVHSDGRPILGLDSRDLLEITLEVCPEAIFIPAHIWTPHFSVFGAYSGFDTLEECFGDLTGYIHALETGLSSDPPMNWRLSALDGYTLVSNSDAHSPANLAREANLFETTLDYPSISVALKNSDSQGFKGTLEFFPEEGKYHYDGHRNCKVCMKPSETRNRAGICPACGGKITVGVLHRVEVLADREEGFKPPEAKPFESLIPLLEVIAASNGVTTSSQKVKEKYTDLINKLGPELFILREAPFEDIELQAGPLVSEGIRRLRAGKVEVLPGYDGEYGKIKILDQDEISRINGQMGFFKEKAAKTKKAKERSDRESGAGAKAAKKQDEPLAERSGWQEGLNREQMEAVSAGDPLIAVIAGPGTGKTRTLVNRIMYLMEKRGVPPEQITAVTFTNRAAREMRTRLSSLAGNEEKIKGLTIGTFHAIGLKILSEQSGESKFSLIDENGALAVIEEVLKRFQIKGAPREILKYISLKKSGADISGMKIDFSPEVFFLYCAQLKRYGVLDYDDILLNNLTLLFERRQEDPDDYSWLSRFNYLLVDEFQDINATQYNLIREWGRKSSGIFVIGDPHQSIYGFRGSDAGCFKRLMNDFPQTRLFQLTQNYRSTPEIIHCAQSVIAKQNMDKTALILKPERAGGGKVRRIEATDDFSEALFVAKEINRLVGGIDMLDAHQKPTANPKETGERVPRSFGDIAVLYRTNRQSEILEQCLQKEGIPFVVAGRADFLSDKEVHRALAFFSFVLNPEDILSLSLYLKNSKAGQADLESEIIRQYSASEKSVTSLCCILQSSQYPAGPIKLLNKYEKIICFATPSEIINSWISDNSLQQNRSLELLHNMALMHEDMASFLQNLTIGSESDLRRSGVKKYTPQAVSLSTLHAAKGLEYPVVFLCGVRDGLIPLQNYAGKSNPEEERRLFYVGMTRAQDELMIMVPGAPSPFLVEMPEVDIVTGKTFTPRASPGFEQLSLFKIV